MFLSIQNWPGKRNLKLVKIRKSLKCSKIAIFKIFIGFKWFLTWKNVSKIRIFRIFQENSLKSAIGWHFKPIRSEHHFENHPDWWWWRGRRRRIYWCPWTKCAGYFWVNTKNESYFTGKLINKFLRKFGKKN